MAKPPLGLHALVTTADGIATRWDPGDPKAQNRPLDLSFSTKRGEGFAEATCTLTRRIDLDYPDLNLYDSVQFVGEDGTTAYEGRIGANSRSYDAGHSISVQLAGWMSAAKDRKFSGIYVDRNLSRWGETSRAHRATILAAATVPYSPRLDTDVTNGTPQLATVIEGHGKKGAGFAHYDAGPGNLIGSIYYSFTARSPINTADPWEWYVGMAIGDDLASGVTTTANLEAASGSGTFTPTTARRHGFLQFTYPTFAASDGTSYEVGWGLAVYGDHGLTKRGSDPKGFYASDVIAHIAQNYCPKLSTAGVQDTTYVIPHLTFHDRTFPYDAFLEINKHHLWELAVWEDRTLHYYPSDLTDYDWEVRLTDPGTKVELQGDSTENLANGIVVEFDNVQTGTKDTRTPDDDDALSDTSVENPANEHGIEAWTEITLSSPTTADAAIEMGRIALAEFNAPKAPGTIKITGHIKDRAGNWQQGWKPRAGETIAITDHPNDRPRLIHETQWDNDTKTLTLAVEGPMRRLDAFLDRNAVALKAAGLAA
jgi:hypothetical protein